MILRADARHIPLRDKSVQCVVTSPPYWGLRDYGMPGQIGLERTPDEYIATMVGVFREVWRVLRDDGTVWLNLGDSYASSPSGSFESGNRGRGMEGGEFRSNKAFNTARGGLKPKDLCGMPWRIAFALQADGWYLRSDIIWAKPNPMPESVTDRPTRSHEYIFLLAKRPTYFFDADAIREPASWTRENNPDWQIQRAATNERKGAGNRNAKSGGFTGWDSSDGRNRRDVWTVNSEPCPESHFATFPQRLIEPCILAGTSEKGCCAECGAPRVRELGEATGGTIGKAWLDRSNDAERGNFKTGNSKGYQPAPTIGWRPSCSHDAPSVPCVVFDPFLGSGTVGKVCERLGRRWVGLELSEPYIEIAKHRTAQQGFKFGGAAEAE